MSDDVQSPGEVPPAPPSPEWQRLHPGTILDDALQRIPNVLIGLFLIFTSGGGDAAIEIVQLAIGFAAIFPVVVRYLTGRYRVGTDVVQWRMGVFKKIHTDLPRNRIQTVDTRISVVGRMLGLESVIVSSAGGEAEIRIGLIDTPTANSIRAELAPDIRASDDLDVTATSVDAGTPDAYDSDDEVDLATHSASDLPRVVAVDVGRTFGLVVIAIVAGAFVTGLVTGVIGAGSLFLIVPLVLGAFGIARGIATEAIGFSSLLRADRIQVSRGILARSTLDAPLARVQGVTVKRSLVAQRIGTERISVDTADVSHEDPGSSGRNQTLVDPIAAAGTWRTWAATFLRGPTPEPQQFERVARVSLRRRWFAAARLALVIWVAIAVTGWAASRWIDMGDDTLFVSVALGVIALLSLGAVETLRYRNERWALGDDQVAFRGGALTTSLTAIPRVRTQGTVVKANWFQRRLGVADLVVDTASPTVGGSGRDLHLADAQHVASAVLASADEGGGV